MGSADMIQRPSTIAQIPRPLDAQHGQILTNDVHNLVNSRKRKRSELAVAVDGESVNVYDVQISAVVRNCSLTSSVGQDKSDCDDPSSAAPQHFCLPALFCQAESLPVVGSLAENILRSANSRD